MTLVAVVPVTTSLVAFGSDVDASRRHPTALLGLPLHAAIPVNTLAALR